MYGEVVVFVSLHPLGLVDRAGEMDGIGLGREKMWKKCIEYVRPCLYFNLPWAVP